MAAFIEEEEAQYLIRSVSPNPPTPVPSQPFPSQPFPFLKLPREIRDSIYHYALLRPRDGGRDQRTGICEVHPKLPADRAHKAYWSPYWGTEESTRLFLVNHQVSNEARELFYSTFPFHFPQWVDVALVNATFRDTLCPWARSLIAEIGLKFCLFLNHDPLNLRDPRHAEEARRTIEAVVDLLPNVKRVILTFTFAGFDVPEYQVKEIVACALMVASPLRGFAGLSLEGWDYETAQRARIIREVREALGCQ